MSDQWVWLEKWLGKELPELLEDLNKGANAKDVAALEKAIGLALPDDFKEFYRVHDGQKGKSHVGPFYGLNFLSLKEIRETWKERQEIFQDIDPEAYEDVACYPAGKIQAGANNAGWIPFADDSGGNYLGLDLSPGPKGTVGQVISFGRDERVMYVLGDSMGDFVEWLISQLKAGNFRIEEEGPGQRSFNTKLPPTKHFLSSLRVLMKKATKKSPQQKNVVKKVALKKETQAKVDEKKPSPSKRSKRSPASASKKKVAKKTAPSKVVARRSQVGSSKVRAGKKASPQALKKRVSKKK